MNYKVAVAGQQPFKAPVSTLKGKGSLLQPQEQCIIVAFHHLPEALALVSFKHWMDRVESHLHLRP